MALPIDYFQPQTFAQSNPFLTGFGAGQGLITQGLQNQQLGLNNQILGVNAQYAQPMAQQDLLKSQLNNQILQPQAQYAPQMTLADLALKQAMPGYYGAMSAEAMSKVPLNQAQTQMTEAQIPYMPYQMMGKYYQGLGQYMAHGPASLAVRMQSNPAFQSLVANNPQAQANYTGLMQSALANQVSVPQLPGMPGVNLNASQMPQPTPQQSMQQGATVPTAYGQVSPTDMNAVGNAAQNAYLKTAYTPQQIQQMTYENSAENMLKQVDMPSIAKFAGLAGHANMAGSKYASAFGLNTDPNYQKFVNFKETQAPLIANEIRRAYGSQATDSEQEIMTNLANPIYWDKSPTIALNQMDSLLSTLRANAQAISQPKNMNLAQTLHSISNPMTASPGMSSAGAQTGSRVRVMDPSGKVGTISAANLQAALSNGFKQVQ